MATEEKKSSLDINKIHRRYESLKNDRCGWLHDWATLADMFLPARFRQDYDTTSHKQPRKSRVVNSAGILAMRTLASGMQGGMTSPVRPWFRLTIGDDEDVSSDIGAWLDDVTERMKELLHRSNFYNVVHALYGDLGTFGTGLLIEEADEEGIHFYNIRAGEYVLDVNSKNEVDTFFRHISMSARQIKEMFPDTCPDMVEHIAKDNSGNVQRYDVIHGVFPNTDIDTDIKIGNKGKKFLSVYYMLGSLGTTIEQSLPHILRESGYDNFPAFAPRWDVHGTDVYGRSPAMDVLPDAIRLQRMTDTLLKMQHKIADPPLMVDRSLQAFGVDINPGSLNYADLQRVAQQPIIPIQMPDAASLQHTMTAVSEVENNVYQGLYCDLFRMLIDDNRRQITATEIQAKQQEKMILIGPVVERLNKELLQPMISRTYYLMQEWGALPPYPQNADEIRIDIAFESSLAQAQKVTGTSTIEQYLAFTLNTAQGIPDVIDNVNSDEMIRAYGDRIGVPKAMMRSKQEVEQLRVKRMQQQQQAEQAAQMQQMAQTGVDASSAIKNLGQTPLGADGQSVMDTLLGGGGLGGL